MDFFPFRDFFRWTRVAHRVSLPKECPDERTNLRTSPLQGASGENHELGGFNPKNIVKLEEDHISLSENQPHNHFDIFCLKLPPDKFIYDTGQILSSWGSQILPSESLSMEKWPWDPQITSIFEGKKPSKMRPKLQAKQGAAFVFEVVI